MQRATVLIVEQERASAETLRKALEDDGFQVLVQASAQRALAELRTQPPDALVIDAVLADQSGFAVCRLLREDRALGGLPVLMLTPENSEMDSVLAFEAGADDVVARPFFARELALRLRALLRRHARHERNPSGPMIRCGPVAIDLRERRARVLDTDARLTEREFAVLALLAGKPGRVFRREEILREAWPGDHPTHRVVDAHMKGLRRKLGVAGRLLETVRGAGYRFSDAFEQQVR